MHFTRSLVACAVLMTLSLHAKAAASIGDDELSDSSDISIPASSFGSSSTSLQQSTSRSTYQPSESDDSSSDDMSYDAIVDQLGRENSARQASSRAKILRNTSTDPFDNVLMHGGIGVANYIQRVRLSDGTSYTMNQRGIQAALGLDLFSPNWMAEGTARSFGEEGNSRVRSSVQEFELKVIYKDRTSKHLGYRAGLGLTGRYLTIKEQGLAEAKYTTPSSVATVGGDFFVSDKFSVGADLNARTALIGETIDKNSFDATLRMDTHF